MANSGAWHSTRPSGARTLSSALFCATLLILTSTLIGAQAGSAGDCDPGLKQPEVNPHNAYAQRSGRCEGIYARDIAAANLGVASFTKQFDNFDPKVGNAIRLDWTTPVHNAVHLRAVSLRPRFYYRMDALRPAGVDSWMWPTDVLSILDLDKASLGIVATTTIPLNGTERAMYLPLAVLLKGTADASHRSLLGGISAGKKDTLIPNGDYLRCVVKDSDYPTRCSHPVPGERLSSGVRLKALTAKPCMRHVILRESRSKTVLAKPRSPSRSLYVLTMVPSGGISVAEL